MAPRKAEVETPIRRGRKKRLIGTHELIGGARKHFESGRPIEPGDYLRPFKKHLVDITVSEGQLVRALATANDLFNALEVAGHHVTLGHNGQGFSRSSIDDHEVSTRTSGQRHPPLWIPSRPTLVYFSQAKLDEVARSLSERPRKTLDFEAPIERYRQAVALTS